MAATPPPTFVTYTGNAPPALHRPTALRVTFSDVGAATQNAAERLAALDARVIMNTAFSVVHNPVNPQPPVVQPTVVPVVAAVSSTGAADNIGSGATTPENQPTVRSVPPPIKRQKR